MYKKRVIAEEDYADYDTPNKLKTFFANYVNPNWSYVLLSLISVLCVRDYYTVITGRNIQHFAYVSYLLIIANCLGGLLKYTNDDTYLDLRILLDYIQQVFCLPFIVTDFLIKYNIAPTEIAVIPSILSAVTLFLFFILEYKRQDLTDLNIILSLVIYFITGLEYNFYACGASVFIGCVYFLFKRNEAICLHTNNYQNILMIGFVLFSLLSLDSGVPPQKFFSKNSNRW